MSTKDLFDFHLHTTASDGSLSPEKLLRHLSENGVVRASITDHDTIDGYLEAQDLNWDPTWGLRPVLTSGIEISTRWEVKDLHVLAYNFRISSDRDPFLEELSRRRLERIHKILFLFRKTGFELTETDLPGTSAPGRWHIAQALVRKGYAKSTASAFRKWLQRGRRYDVRLQAVPLEEALRWIQNRGGLAVLAHPHLYFSHPTQLEKLLRTAGGVFSGLELFHSAFPEHQLNKWLDLARRWNLAISGGSDFHHPHHGRFVGKGVGGRPLFSENLNGLFLDLFS